MNSLSLFVILNEAEGLTAGRCEDPSFRSGLSHRRIKKYQIIQRPAITEDILIMKASNTRNCMLLALSLITFVWGCGYKSRSESLSHLDSVTVSPIANETVEYGLEDSLGDALKQEFSNQGNWGEGTDSVFNGSIKTYEIFPISLDQNNQPEQYRILLGMSFVFEDLKQNKVLRNEKDYEKIYDFYVVPDRGEPPKTLAEAKTDLADETAEDIVSSIVKEW